MASPAGVYDVTLRVLFLRWIIQVEGPHVQQDVFHFSLIDFRPFHLLCLLFIIDRMKQPLPKKKKNKKHKSTATPSHTEAVCLVGAREEHEATLLCFTLDL